jgi:hypothetical protein
MTGKLDAQMCWLRSHWLVQSSSGQVLPILHELGRALAASGDWGEAAVTFERALAISRGEIPMHALPDQVAPPKPRRLEVSVTRRSKRFWMPFEPRFSKRFGKVFLWAYSGHLLISFLGF